MVRWQHESGNKSHSGQTVTGAIIFLQLNQPALTLPSILLLRHSFQYFPHQVNKLGVLTINSQPSAHCVPRLIPSDKTKILGLKPFGQFGHKLDTGLKTLIVPATTKCLAGAIPEAMSSKKLTSSSSQGVTWMLSIQKVFTSTFFPAKRTCWLSSKSWGGGLELTSRLSKTLPSS